MNDRDANWLTALAVETRYPDVPATLCTQERAERALDIARRIKVFCRERLTAAAG